MESAPLSRSQIAYWRWTRLLTAALLLAWFSITFFPGYFADELNDYELFGFPLGFYTFAQGALIAYLVIILIYVKAMNRLDRHFGVSEAGKTGRRT